jgi:hypothetical protein
MNNVRESILNYINILSDEELDRLYMLILQNAPAVPPLADEVEIATNINPNDEYIPMEDFDWD